MDDVFQQLRFFEAENTFLARERDGLVEALRTALRISNHTEAEIDLTLLAIRGRARSSWAEVVKPEPKRTEEDTDAEWKKFEEALRDPPAPSERLIQTVRKPPLWGDGEA